MEILLWVVFGVVAGASARFIMPGPSAGGIPVAIFLGVGGALLGGWIGTLIPGVANTGFDVRSLLMAIIGSLGVLFVYRTYALRGTT